jgi:LmbE family N-acetylglucosaminyl deacetylase
MKLLAIGAHLDDIELGCGGTIARAVANGATAKMLVMSRSAYANFDGQVLRTDDEAIAEGREAARRLGVTDLEVLDFHTKDIPHESETVEAIDRIVSGFRPDLILTHWAFDTHQAHEGVSRSTISAARWCRSILMYEPMPPSGRSWVGFRPQAYVEIGGQIEAKIDSLRAHASQLRKYGEGWLDAVRARAVYRGFETGHSHAEAFEVLRYGLEV